MLPPIVSGLAGAALFAIGASRATEERKLTGAVLKAGQSQDTRGVDDPPSALRGAGLLFEELRAGVFAAEVDAAEVDSSRNGKSLGRDGIICAHERRMFGVKNEGVRIRVTRDEEPDGVIMRVR